MRLLMICFVLVSTTVYSQDNRSSLKTYINKNTYLLGGSMNGSFRSYSRSTGSEANPEQGTAVDLKGDFKLGYFFYKNIALGAQASVNHFNYTNQAVGAGANSTYFLYGPFVRAYLANKFFGETGVSLGTENLDSNLNSKLLEGKLTLGYSLFLNSRVAVEPIISFRYLQNTPTSSERTMRQREFGPSFGLSVQAFLYRGKMAVNTNLRRSKY